MFSNCRRDSWTEGPGSQGELGAVIPFLALWESGPQMGVAEA